MSKQTLMTLSLALTSVLGLGACDSIQPGEYSVFRVSYGESAQDLACGVTDPTLATLPTGDSYGDPETLVIFAHDDVYYLEYEGLGVDGLVKIGFTNYLPQRLEAWPPTTKILATEPGDFRLERQRHQEFAEYLIEREWFTYGPRLHAHIAALPTHDWSA